MGTRKVKRGKDEVNGQSGRGVPRPHTGPGNRLWPTRLNDSGRLGNTVWPRWLMAGGRDYHR